MQRRNWRREVARLILLISLATMLWQVGKGGSSLVGNAEGVAALVRMTGVLRPIEGRLTLLHSHALYDRANIKHLNGVPAVVGPDIRWPAFGGAEPKHGREGKRSPGISRDRAYLEIYRGRVAAAVVEFAKAADMDANNAMLWSDLAASRLSLGRQGQEPHHFLDALVAIGKAMDHDSRLPAAHFNHALALANLGLRRSSTEAWSKFLDLETDSSWSQEAQDRRRRQMQPSRAEVWAVERSRLELLVQGAEVEVIREITRAYPRAAGDYARDQLLAQWAEKRAQGLKRESDRVLEAAAAIGEVVAHTTGDFTVAVTVAAIVQAETNLIDTARIDSLVIGHREYQSAKVLLLGMEYSRAQLAFERASRALHRGRSPLALWADFNVSVCLYYRPDFSKTIDSLTRLLQSVDERRFPTLFGRIYWMLGLSRYMLAQPTDALGAYRKALAAFESAGDLEGEAAVNRLIAQVYDFLGQPRQGWEHHHAALTALGELRATRTSLSIIGRAAVAVEQFEPRLALTFHDEAVSLASVSTSPLERLVPVLERARCFIRKGNRDRAAADLTRAWELASDLGDEQLRHGVEASITFAEGEMRHKTDPLSALRAFSHALKYFEDTGNGPRQVEAYDARARTYAAAGLPVEAESDWWRGIGLIAKQRASVLGEQLKISFFDRPQLQEIYDRFATFLLAQGRIEEALDLVEGGRTRVLLDRVEATGTTRTSQPDRLNINKIRRGLPPRVALVHYLLLEEELTIWVTTRQASQLVDVGPGAVEIRRLVAQLRAGLMAPGPTASSRAAAHHAAVELYDILVRATLQHTPIGTCLVLVPDKEINLVPFAALFDARSGQHLVEQRALLLAPSAGLFSRALDTDRYRQRVGSGNVLAIGDPAFEANLFPWLDPLPAARREVAAVAGVYPQCEVLIGQKASREAFLKMAPHQEILHVAAHAQLNAQHPEFSSLVLAPSGGAHSSGLIFAHEIAELKLHATRLVVLSGCNTAAGAASRGEGVLSLARSFLSAGVPAVVASLWPVEDRATAELFERFYSHLHQDGDPVQALRSAQIELLGHTEDVMKSPVSWAGFLVVGGVAPVN